MNLLVNSYYLRLILILGTHLLVFASGCGSTPIHGAFVSQEKNIWVEDSMNAGLSYCVSNNDGSKADPVCYPARKPTSGERLPPPSTTTK